MADNRTMAQLLQAPTEGYEDAIVIPEINANFELKHGLIDLVQNKQFFGHDKEDPHAHIRYFNKITSIMRFSNVPSTSIKLMLFPFSLEGLARIWLEKELPRSILTWDDLVSKFINQFFPPSKTTNLRNEITRFQQRFDESFYEAWDRFNDLLRACPHHGFSELHQLDTFYNALNANDQDSLNSAAGGNFLDKMPRDCLKIIESKSKVCNSRNKAVVAKVSSNSSTLGISPDIVALTTEVSELKNMMKTMLIDKQKAQAPATVKAVEQSCVTCGGAHSYRKCPATDGNVYRDNIQEYVSQAVAANFNQGNTNSRPLMVSNQIRPPDFPPIQNNQNHFNQGTNFNQNRGTNFNQNRGSNFNQGQVYQPPTNQNPVYQAPAQQMKGVSKTDFENYVKANDDVLRNMENQGQGLQNQMTNLTKMFSKFISSNIASTSNSGPSTPLVPTPVVSSPLKEPEQNPETSMDKVQKPNTAQVPPPEDHDSIFIRIPKPTSYQPKLPYPERMKVRENDKPSAQQSRFMKLFKQLRLEIGLRDALVEMPKFNKWLSTLLRNKEKLDEIAITTVNGKCSAIILNKVPEKLEDPGKFLIPCALQELDRTNALADSGASINILPHSIYKQLGLEALKPTRMTLDLANHFRYEHKTMVECYDSEDDIDEIDAFLAKEVSSNFEEGYLDSERDVIFLENLLSDDTTHNLDFIRVICWGGGVYGNGITLIDFRHEPNKMNPSLSTSITFSPKNDPLHHEYSARENTLTLPSRIDREHEEYLSLMTLLYEISTSQSLENFPASPIPVEDSDPVQEEIDIFLVPDDLIPPGVENDESEDEDNSTFLPEHETPNLDYQDNPSAPRPPPELPMLENTP
ncbi:reverse transcriptase domain-containing protein [Tanacetum coccineum]